MKLFFTYLKTKKNTFLAMFIFVLIFTVSFLLYRLPVGALIYPMCICLIIGFIIVIIDYMKVRRKYNEIKLLNQLTSELITQFPCPDHIIEKEYIDLICQIQRELADVQFKNESEYREMIDYYTVWVHQIKTPIASMKLALENEDSPLSRRLSVELFRIEQYVEMVLAFLRLTSDSTDYLFKEYDIDRIIRSSVKRFSYDFINRNLQLKYNDVKIKYITDEKWFGFVIEQIISNALKYTPKGYIEIGSPAENVVCISDTGMCILPDDLPRIFEKGYTGNTGRADKNSSGLGLYLCKQICDKLGIDIKIESEPEKGTSVFLYLDQRKVNLE